MTPKLTPAELDELEALLAKATEGPWAPPRRSERSLQFRISDDAGEAIANVWGLNEEAVANAALIVALVNSAPSLLASARAVEGMATALEAADVVIRYVDERLWIGRPDHVRDRPAGVDSALRTFRATFATHRGRSA